MLDAKVCLVTGGGSGIGRATALEMIDQGASAVVVTDIDPAGGAETVAQGRARGGDIAFIASDISDAESVRALMSQVQERFRRLDVLHNNAGVLDSQLTGMTTIETCPEEAWDRVFAVNVKGTWLCTKYGIPLLRRSQAAAIVNCASVSALTAIADEPAYCASKAAVLQMTKNIALELAPDGIRCNCYCPSSVDTPMIHAPDVDAAERELRLTARYLVPRLGKPSEIARLVCFLASDDAAFINGASFLIDGGLLAWRGSRS